MEIIRESFVDIIKNSINLTPKESIIPIKRGYLVSIEKLGKEVVYLVFNKSFLRTMCKDYLGDDAPSEEALEDMARELANLTVGHAKVISEKKNKIFNISTPVFLGIKPINNCDRGIHFRLKNKGHCSIYMRSAHKKA